MITMNIEKDGIDLFKAIVEQYPENIEIDEIEYSFDGTSFFQVFLDITQFTLPIIASILISKEGKSKIFTIKKDGIEITIPIKQELTLEEVKKFLQVYLDDEK